MKRSEMINIILYLTHGPSQYPGHKNDAEAILNGIELAGMAPPLALVHNSPHPPGHEFHGPNKVWENMWEPEDEN